MDTRDIPETLPQAPPARTATTLFVGLIAGVALVRVFFTTCMMTTTGDVIRNVVYGVLIQRVSPAAAARPLAGYHGLDWICWSEVPYNYPIITLLFFTTLAALWPTIFFAKLALTLLEAVNAVLVYRFTRDRWLAALYWASPVSVWWVSREGQFEPLQNLFVLGALCLLGRLAPLAFLMLALAIQVKLTAVLLFPFFLVTLWRRDRAQTFRCLLAFIGGFLPTLLALRAYPVLNVVSAHLAVMGFNPYYWNPFVAELSDWVPGWLAFMNQGATYGVLALLAWSMVRGPARWACLAPLVFLMAIKLHTNVQFWYFILWPAFILPIPDRRLRWTLFLLYPLLDISSTLALFGHIVGQPNPVFYPLIGVFRPLP